ncbi:putative ensconsin-like [Cocos nucifera]|nr:putative ensconsin-like [Cocos nucifera]
MTLSPPTEVPTSTSLYEEEIKKKKKMITRRARPQQNSRESSDDNMNWDNAFFDDWRVVKALVDACVFPHIVKRITCTNLDQQVGHQLIANIEMINTEKVEASKAVEKA